MGGSLAGAGKKASVERGRRTILTIEVPKLQLDTQDWF
jgi:hypothetical protein